MFRTAKKAPFAFLMFPYCIGRDPSRLVRARLLATALTVSDPMPKTPDKKANAATFDEVLQPWRELSDTGIRRSSRDYLRLSSLLSTAKGSFLPVVVVRALRAVGRLNASSVSCLEVSIE